MHCLNMTSFLISVDLFNRKWGFSVTFLFLNQLSSNLAQRFKIGCWFLFLAQKVVLGTISDNMTQQPLFYVTFGQTPLKNSIAMAAPKVSGDQKLFERVCYMLKLKVRKFQLPTLNSFWAVLKKPAVPK